MSSREYKLLGLQLGINVSGRSSIEVAQSEGGTANNANSRRLACSAELGNDRAETPDQVVAVELIARHQVLCKVSDSTRIPRLRNSRGTWAGSAGMK